MHGFELAGRLLDLTAASTVQVASFPGRLHIDWICTNHSQLPSVCAMGVSTQHVQLGHILVCIS